MSGKGIIHELYGPRESAALVKLCRDEDDRTRFLVRQKIGEKLTADESFMIQPGIDQLLLTCTTSQFANSEQECINVAVFIHNGLRRTDPFPKQDDRSRTYAAKALTCLAFFMGALEMRRQRRGAPGPDYYRGLSRTKFRACGFSDIADHHLQWENLLAEKLGG